MIRCLLFLSLTLLSFSSRATVWDDTNQWSPAWEMQYQNWVRSNWQSDVFARSMLPTGRSNPYYGVHPDCADTVYSMRMIFAYENSLPFVVLDPTGSGRKMTNRLKRFDKIHDQDQRFHHFLEFMYDALSTASLPNDTFPVAITPEYVHAGALMMTVKKNHHSWSVKDILPIGVPWLIFASTVSSTTTLQLQERKSWPNPFWVFEEDQSPAGNGGFRNFRPIEYIGAAVWEVPGYNEEQYRIPLGKWQKFAQGRLASKQEAPEQLLRRLLDTACVDARSRVGAVNDGIYYLQAHPSQCMDAATYDNFSTPNRDRRLFDDLAALRNAYRGVLNSGKGSQVPADLIRQLEVIFPAALRTASFETQMMQASPIGPLSVCTIEYAPGHSADLAEIKRRSFAGFLSSNPNEEIEYRWGEYRGHSERARSCQSWDLYTPDLRTAN